MKRENRRAGDASPFFDRLGEWMRGEELLLSLEEPEKKRKTDPSHPEVPEETKKKRPVRRLEKARMRVFRIFYAILAVLCCLTLAATLLRAVADLPQAGTLSDTAAPLMKEYIENAVEETGAVNVVAAVILSYRAFDTLGESFVLFTALCCVTVLLRRDAKTGRERVVYTDLSHDGILRKTAAFVSPMILLYGVYVMLNGHLSPGGGFSGGAVAGAGLILLSAGTGFATTDRLFTEKTFRGVCGCALGFYALSKTYTFFCEANGLPSGIPKGTPGTLISGGLILPLNLAVGAVVAMTIFGMYSLFKRGTIGSGKTKTKYREKKEGTDDAADPGGTL